MYVGATSGVLGGCAYIAYKVLGYSIRCARFVRFGSVLLCVALRAVC